MGSLAGHRIIQHGLALEERHIWKTLAMMEEPQTYRMAFLNKGGLWSCPVEGCPGRTATSTAMRVHFLHQHVLVTVVILEERNLSHPRCLRCNILVPWLTLDKRHPATAQCARGVERKRRRLAEAELRESTERAFEACEYRCKM